MTAPADTTIAEMVSMAIKAQDAQRPRSIQSREGLLGPSDLGFCRQKAALVTREVPPSDSKSMWPAVIGTTLGESVEIALHNRFPTWKFGNLDGIRIEHTFPSGATLGGSFDILVPEWNTLLDVKTKDGYEWVKREPWSRNYLYQTHTYVLGAIDAGLLDPTKPIQVGLVYLDRSGEIETPYVVTRPYDPSLEDEIDSWITDVVYAVKNNEDAMRDIPAPVCEKICEFFTVCRGQLPDSDADLITDPELIGAMKMYLEGTDLGKEAKRLTSQAKTMLDGVSGVGEGIQVRWTTVQGSQVPSFERSTYQKIDVRQLRQS